MTLIWDTGVNAGTPSGGHVLGEYSERCISWCEADNTYAAVYVREAASVTYFCYGYGDDNSWTEEILVRSDAASGRFAIQATVDHCSLDVDQTGGVHDHVHIAWSTTGNIVYHSELTDPTDPSESGGATWTTWGGNRYQRVDNTGNSTCPSVSVDGNGDPHVVWCRASNTVRYNYGNGASHAFTRASTITLSTPSKQTAPCIVAVTDDTRDLYVFYGSGNTIKYRYCDKGNNPLNLVNWTAAATVLDYGLGPAPLGSSVYYWYDAGGALAQIMVASKNSSGIIRTNWYDEGNVNGWGGGWRTAGGTLETVTADLIQITQVDADDFALIYVPYGGTDDVKFGFTDYGAGQYDFTAATFKYCANSVPLYMGSETRGRENDDYSFGMLHVQSVDDIMFDLVRTNDSPTANSLDPDNGDREDEGQAITCSWTFSDPGQAQTRRRIQVQEYGGDWSSIVYDSNEQDGATASWDIPASTLDFDTHYEWRVKVWDDEKGDEYDPYSESDWVT